MSQRAYRAAVLASLALAAAAFCADDPTPPEELAQRAFPGAAVERRSIVLTEAQLERVKVLAGKRPDSPIVIAYSATRDGQPAGTAYFDVHRVHSVSETLLLVVDPTGGLARVEVLAFNEPARYRAPLAWLAQFAGRGLDDELKLNKGVHGISGATLTARATTKAVRRALAIHQVLREAAP